MKFECIANRRRIPRRRTVQYLFLSLTLVFTGSVSAQDWNFDPVIRVAAEVDDNAELSVRTDNEVDLRGALIEGSADIGYSSQTTDFDITPRILIRSYSDNPELESDDIFVRSSLRHRMRSSNIGLRVHYDQQTVRTAERAESDFDIEDADEISEGDSGRVAVRGNRDRWRITPSWGYRFSPTNSVAADVNHYDVNYDDVFLNLLTDYTDTRGNFFFRHGFSNVNTGVIQLTGRTYDSADANSTVSGYGAQVGVERDLSQTTRLRAMVGFETTEGDLDSADGTQPVGNITLTRNLQTIRILATYRRSINATGAGRLSSRDSLSLNFNRQLNNKISAGIGVRAYQSRGLDDSLLIDDRDYIQLRSRFVWNLSQQFSLEFDYRYTMLNRVELGERANSNAILVWFSYQPTRVID